MPVSQIRSGRFMLGAPPVGILSPKKEVDRFNSAVS